MSRRAFTLIELLVVVAIVATMVSVSVVGFRAGQSAVRVRGAARDIVSSIRRARSQALVLMQPAIVTYSMTRVDDEVCAQIEVVGAKMSSPGKDTDVVQTLSGEPIQRNGEKVPERDAKDGEGEPLLAESDGQTVEDILYAPIAEDVVKGVRIKVTIGDEFLAREEAEKKSNRISVFSNVDYLLGRYKEAQEKKAATEEKSESSGGGVSLDEDEQKSVRVVWEANGRCDNPHRVWVYLDGAKPESGLCIKVDRFGAVKVVSSDEEI